jgi:hypothetical protein
MTARLRLIFPPFSALLIFALMFVCLEGPVLYWEWLARPQVLDLSFRPGTALIGLGAFGYGAYRVLAFHPAFRPAYREWLERSPWTSRKPLPLGPVALLFEDTLMLGLLTGLAITQPGLHPARVVTLALIGYLVWLLRSFWTTGVASFGYVGAFGLGLVVRLWPEPWLSLAAASVVAVFSQVGLRRSLARFPWPKPWHSDLVKYLSAGKGINRRSSQRTRSPVDGRSTSSSPVRLTGHGSIVGMRS